MPRITLNPGLREFLSFREQYDGLVADLERAGYEVTLVDPVEKSQIPDAPRGTFYPGEPSLVDLFIRVSEGAVAADALVRLISARLRGGTRNTRTGEIILPDGAVHTFELPGE
jgi:hypothetical protein